MSQTRKHFSLVANGRRVAAHITVFLFTEIRSCIRHDMYLLDSNKDGSHAAGAEHFDGCFFVDLCSFYIFHLVFFLFLVLVLVRSVTVRSSSLSAYAFFVSCFLGSFFFVYFFEIFFHELFSFFFPFFRK